MAKTRNSALAAVLLVLCVLGILLLLAVPTFQHSLGEVRIVKETSHGRIVAMMLMNYAGTHAGHFPDSLDVIVNDSLLVPPGQRTDLEPFLCREGTRDYKWTLTPGLTTSSPAETVLFQSVDAYRVDDKTGKIEAVVGGTVNWMENVPEK
jgi:type II secretory pathway pseudopilin PulG